MPSNNKGFTLIEFLIVLAIFAIIAAIAIGEYTDDKGTTAPMVVPETVVEHVPPAVSLYEDTKPKVTCLEGFKFITTGTSTVQMKDEYNNGIRC